MEKSSGTLYWRAYTGQVIEETDTSGDMQRDYVFFDGRRIAWSEPNGSGGYSVYYYFADVLGSTRVVTDSSGNVCFDADYYPYGQENDYTTSCTPGYKFAGYEFDSETGNYYAYARYYDPSLGRFMSPDPADVAAADPTNPQSWNRYAYTMNNPVSFIDPFGLCEDTQGNSVPCQPGDPNNVVYGFFSNTDCGVGEDPGFCSPPTPIGESLEDYELQIMQRWGLEWALSGMIPRLSGRGGSAASAAPQTPTPQTQGHPLANCIADSGNEASLQGILKGASGGKLGNGWFASTFLGNPFSDLIQLAAGGTGWGAAAGDAASLGTPSALRAVPNVSFSYTSTTAAETPSGFSAVMSHIEGYLPLGDVASGAADVLEGFGYFVQAPINITATGFGAVVCGAAYY